MIKNNSNSLKTSVAGISQEIFQTLPAEDQSFLSMLDRLGYDLETLYRKALGNK